MRITVRNKIRFTVISIVALLSLFMFIFFTSRQRTILLDGFETEIESITETVALGVTLGLKSKDTSLVQNSVNFFQTDPRVGFVALVNGEETVAAYPAGFELDAALLSSDHLIVKRAEITTKSISGEIVVGSSTATIHQRIQKIWLIGATVSLSALLVGAVGAHWLAYSVVRPMLTLRNETRRISEDNLTHTLAKESIDEIGQLTDAFNEVFVKMRRALIEVETERVSLEQRMEETENENQQLHQQVQNLSELADQAGRALQEIVIGMEEVKPIMESVATASEKHSLTSELARRLSTEAPEDFIQAQFSDR